ncbi:hypothetical protein LCGC14_0514640 [marine sediment metagenome]|uniref:Uncharacterized protein n=1 Tax=marine sediment metagenome TaxID=412755 RepID=A0A0F9S099_9ZZZZ
MGWLVGFCVLLILVGVFMIGIGFHCIMDILGG